MNLDLFFYEYCTWYIDKVQNLFNIFPKTNWVISNKTYTIIIEYTKTTD